jgi:putative DNA primase/helicase
LYRLPELLDAGPSEVIFVSEGEKDADRLAALGLTATTNPEGSGKWRDEYTATLEGRRAAILPDNDEEGRKHVEKIARALYGRAASVKVVVLPGLPEKGDVSDWLDAGNAVEELPRILDETPQWEPPSSTADTPDRFDDVGTLLSDVVEESMEWLWDGRIPLGKLTARAITALSLRAAYTVTTAYTGHDNSASTVCEHCVHGERRWQVYGEGTY